MAQSRTLGALAGAIDAPIFPWTAVPSRRRSIFVRWLSQARDGLYLPPVRRSGRRGAASPLASDAAFEQLYFTMADPLFIYLTRRTADPETARDLWSETWARAYEGRMRFRGTTQAEKEAWVRGIAKHILAGYYRRGKVQGRAMERLRLERPDLGQRDLERVERAAALDTLRGDVRQALSKLPRAQHEAVELRIVDQLSYAEVAERSGASEQTVRARVSRGLKALATLLDRDMADFDLGDWT